MQQRNSLLQKKISFHKKVLDINALFIISPPFFPSVQLSLTGIHFHKNFSPNDIALSGHHETWERVDTSHKDCYKKILFSRYQMRVNTKREPLRFTMIEIALATAMKKAITISTKKMHLGFQAGLISFFKRLLLK